MFLNEHSFGGGNCQNLLIGFQCNCFSPDGITLGCCIWMNYKWFISNEDRSRDTLQCNLSVATLGQDSAGENYLVSILLE